LNQQHVMLTFMSYLAKGTALPLPPIMYSDNINIVQGNTIAAFWPNPASSFDKGQPQSPPSISTYIYILHIYENLPTQSFPPIIVEFIWLWKALYLLLAHWTLSLLWAYLSSVPTNLAGGDGRCRKDKG
jgi:hypothetical protein